MSIDVRIVRMNMAEKKHGRLKAFIDIQINNVLLIKGLFIMSGNKGLFVSMPRHKGKDDKWYEVVQILDSQLKENIFSHILLEYKKREGIS